MTLTNYIGVVPDAGQPIIAHMQQSSLLDRLGGVLTNSKEKLRAAGRTVKRNLDLIMFGAMYVSVVGEVATGGFELLRNPDMFPMLGHVETTLDKVYLAITATGAGLLPLWAAAYYSLLTNGRPRGVSQ